MLVSTWASDSLQKVPKRLAKDTRLERKRHPIRVRKTPNRISYYHIYFFMVWLFKNSLYSELFPLNTLMSTFP